MTKTTLLSTVAAIGLAVSMGAALAQAPSERGGAAGGAASGTMERGAPAGGMERGGASGGAASDHKSGSTEQSPSKAGASDQRAQTPAPANKADGRPDGKNAQAPAANDGKTNSKMSSDKAPDHSAQKTGDAKQGTDSSKQGADSKFGTNAQAQPGSKSTVGAASSSETKMTTEQRTQIREKVIATGPKVTNVNFSLNVGTVVPRTVQVVDVPTVIIDMHPEWRGYRYFVVNDQVIIVERDSLRIVAVLDV